MFARTDCCGSRAITRSAGTSTTPARMASAGRWATSGTSPTRIAPLLGRRRPARQSKSASWPWPSSAAIPNTSPRCRSNDTPSSWPDTARSRTASTGVVCAGVCWRVDAACCASGPPAPSMSATIPSSPLSTGLRVATSWPSRNTVARSQIARTSPRRCEMNRTERPSSRQRRITRKTRSARSDGRAAVTSSRIKRSGRRASTRASSMMRSEGRGRSPAISPRSSDPRPSSASQPRTAPTSLPVRRRFSHTVRSGASAGSWKTAPSPARWAAAGVPSCTSRPRTAMRPLSARITPVSALTRVLLPAPLAPNKAWISPRATPRFASSRATTAP